MIDVFQGDLPPATLLRGSHLDTLLTAADQACRDHGVHLADSLFIATLTADAARSVVQFAQRAPFGPFKVVIVRLDGAAEQAQNILLKVLEEPPSLVRFILVATARPLPVIVSRCQVITVPDPEPRREPDGKVAAQVSAALKAVAAADLTALDAAMAGWGDQHQSVLNTLLTETSMSASDAEERWRARRLIGLLGRFSGASSRLAAHAALVAELSDRKHHD